MKDRNVQHASRFRLTKVPGTDDVYDLIPAPGEVYEEGTLINKSALLKDATAALFGLGTDAVPDDALAALSRFHKGLGNEYVWAKIKSTIEIVYDSEGFKQWVSSSSSMSQEFTWYYADEIGENLTLVNPQTVSVSYNVSTNANKLIGKFIYLSSNPSTVYKVPADATVSSARENGVYNVYLSKVIPVKSSYSVITTFGYVNSPDKNAYPPPIDDGYTYEYLGQFGDKARIAKGSYVGTGTYGSSNPNSLTFGFEPQVLFISGKPVSWGTNLPNIGQIINNKTSTECIVGFSYGSDNGASAGGTGSPRMLHGMFDNKTITWFANSEPVQLNTKGVTYEYIAIG